MVIYTEIPTNVVPIYGSFFILLIHFNEPHLIESNIFQRYINVSQLPHCENHFRRFCCILLYLWDQIRRISFNEYLKVAVIWTVRPFDNKKFRVLQIFSTKANLVSMFFNCFYVILFIITFCRRLQDAYIQNVAFHDVRLYYDALPNDATTYGAVLHCILLQ